MVQAEVESQDAAGIDIRSWNMVKKNIIYYYFYK